LRFCLTNAGNGDTIDFDLAPGDETITVADALPTISNSITIDGTTQPGSSNGPSVEIDGADIEADGLDVAAGDVLIQGLAIYGFNGNGVELSGTGDTISGCLIGTDTDGDEDVGNVTGVLVEGGDDTVGDSTGVAKTVVSGNEQDGIDVSGANATGDLITNAFIGVGLTGLTGLGNGGYGIRFMGVANNTVSGNIITDNSNVDFELQGTTHSNIVGNYFGLARNGTSSLASADSGPGIELDSLCSDNTIGGLGTKIIGGAGTPGRNFISGNDTNSTVSWA